MLTYVTSGLQPTGTLSLSLDTGAEVASKTYLIGICGQWFNNPFDLVFDGVACTTIAQENTLDANDVIEWHTATITSGGSKTLSWNASGIQFRVAVHLWEVSPIGDLASAVMTLAHDTEAPYNITATQGAAAVGILLGEGASVSGKGIVGLADEDYAATYLEAGVNFYSVAASEQKLTAGAKAVNADVDGENTSRILMTTLNIPVV